MELEIFSEQDGDALFNMLLGCREGQKSPQESWVVPKVSCSDMLNKSSAVHLGVWNNNQTTNKSCKSIRVDYVYTVVCHLDIIYGMGFFAWDFVI